MIRIRWERRDGHMLIAVNGHEPDAVKGNAVVCAAVSVLMQGFVAVMQAIAFQNPTLVETIEGCTLCEHAAHDGRECYEPRRNEECCDCGGT